MNRGNRASFASDTATAGGSDLRRECSSRASVAVTSESTRRAMHVARARERFVQRAMRAREGRGGSAAFRRWVDGRNRCDQHCLDRLLCEVALVGDTRAVRFLLRRGANLHGVDSESRGGRCALSAAVESGRLGLVRKLITLGADLKSAGERETLLGIAVRRGNLSIVRELLARGVDPNEPVHPRDWDVSPLIIALAEAQTACVEELLCHGANPNVVCRDLDAMGGYSFGAPIPGQNSNPCHPLALAEATDNAAAVRMLVRYGARLGRSDVGAGFLVPERLRARARNPLHRVLRLLRRRAGLAAIHRALVLVRDLDELNGTLLEQACLSRRLEVVRHLLALGADPNEVCRRELPELTGGALGIARALLDYGYYGGEAGQSAPLHAAIQHSYPWLVRLLLNPSVRLRTCRGPKEEMEALEYTALMHAVAYDEAGCAMILLAHGADPNLGCCGFPRAGNVDAFVRRIARGEFYPPSLSEVGEAWDAAGVPLHVAVITGNVRMVRLLLRHGADPAAAAGLDEHVALLCPDALRADIAMLLRERREALAQPVRPLAAVAGSGSGER